MTTAQAALPAPATPAGVSGFDPKGLLQFLKRGEIALAIGVVAIIAMLILPVPSWLLDMTLAASITSSVLILMTALFIQKPLEFSTFPTVLLITTLLRLSLNLATTRLILAHGHEGTGAAGHVIEAFGNFVMGGNFVIGLIVFGILVVVNFVVITKGSSRIAEVAARFSLDAMPGKQMAIDADLSAGMIDETVARQRRKELEEESTFFGAMDGAAKFVRGDAVAGLMITGINMVGGIIIGVVQMKLSFGQATHSYTLLTVGDGLVSQIPALIVSVAAGLLVSKAGVSGATDKALFGQLGNYPSALGLSAILLAAMGLLPGMPKIPFAILALGAGALAWRMPKIKARRVAAEASAAAAPAEAAEEPIAATLAIDTIRLELGYGLLALVNQQNGTRLTDQIRGLRKQLAADMGFVLPSVRIQDNLQLAPNSYTIRIKEIEAARGEIRPNMLLAMDPNGAPIPLPGEPTNEPTFGLPAMWISTASREEAHFRGLTVVDPATVVTTHLTEVVKDYLADLLSYAETQKLLDTLGEGSPKLVADVVPSQITVNGLQRVLQSLLAERVSIRDLPAILEGIAEAAAHTRNIGQIVEHVRARLARQLCDGNVNAAGFVPLLTLSPDWEQAFAEATGGGTGEERSFSMAPSKLQQFIATVRGAYEGMAQQGETPVLLTSPAARPFVRSIVERFRPQTCVMSQSEIHPKARIRTLGQV